MFLGIDLGTSELKAVLLNERHQMVGVARSPLQVDHPQPLWSEQSPHAWWQALEQVMAQLQADHPSALAQLQAVGLSGQMHGAVLLDEHEAVLRPALLWNDGRSAEQCHTLHQRLPNLPQITGNLAMPGFTAPKVQWVREHEPRCFEQLRRVLLPKDWLRLQLTGECVSDMSDAAGTLWLDTGRRDWSLDALHACGLGREHMPRLVEGSAESARIKPALCQRWGLPAQVPVAGGAGDNAASAIGMGLVEPGQGFVSLGTSGVVFVNSDRYDPQPAQALHTFCHALPDRWHQMSVMLSAASALTWAKRLLGFAHESDLLQAAAQLKAHEQAQAPLFLPYLNGERSPHNNPLATGSWIGLRAEHGREDLAYAVAEGVGFGLLDGMRSFPTQGRTWDTLSLVGGGSRSPWWSQSLSDTFGLNLQVHEGADNGGALGAARLAYLCVGADPASVCLAPPTQRMHSPERHRHSQLMERHARFVKAYATAH